MQGSRHYDSIRVEAFSDAVLAIVLTVLVLELRGPENKPGELPAALAGMWPSFVAFFLSFVRVSVIWMNHHELFAHVRRVDRRLLWRNLWLLLNCTIIPLPTAMLAGALRGGNTADLRAATIIYVLLAAVLVASWLPMIGHLRKQPELLRQDADVAFFHRQRLRARRGFAIDVLACVAAYFAPVPALILWAVSLLVVARIGSREISRAGGATPA